MYNKGENVLFVWKYCSVKVELNIKCENNYIHVNDSRFCLIQTAKNK